MATHRKALNPTRTSPPKKGYMQKALQKNLKKLSSVTRKTTHKRGK